MQQERQRQGGGDDGQQPTPPMAGDKKYVADRTSATACPSPFNLDQQPQPAARTAAATRPAESARGRLLTRGLTAILRRHEEDAVHEKGRELLARGSRLLSRRISSLLRPHKEDAVPEKSTEQADSCRRLPTQSYRSDASFDEDGHEDDRAPEEGACRGLFEASMLWLSAHGPSLTAPLLALLVIAASVTWSLYEYAGSAAVALAGPVIFAAKASVATAQACYAMVFLPVSRGLVTTLR